MKTFLGVVILVLIVLLSFALASGILVLAAYGLGWLILKLIPLALTPFEASALSMIAIIAIAAATYKIIDAIMGMAIDDDDDDDDDFDDDDFDDDDLNGHGIPKLYFTKRNKR